MRRRCLFEDDWKCFPLSSDYMVSSTGRILSYKRGDWRELQPYLGANGYLYVNLRIDMQTIRYYIHRLVAETYIPNPYDKRVVNHIDGDKLNNSVDNLEWVTDQENSIHAYRNGLSRMPSRECIFEANRRPVEAVCLATGERMLFHSQAEASEVLGIERSHLNMALRGRCPHARGYVFNYVSKEVV